MNSWTVWDNRTNTAAIVADLPQVGKSSEDADEMVGLLNKLEAERVAKGEH